MEGKQFDKDIKKYVDDLLVPSLLDLKKNFCVREVRSFKLSEELTNILNTKHGLEDIEYIFKVDLYCMRISIIFKYKGNEVTIRNIQDGKSMLDYLKECMDKDTNILE